MCNAHMTAPIDVPANVFILFNIFNSSKARNAPIYVIPRIPPPLNTKVFKLYIFFYTNVQQNIT